jgi:hypothetical protein
MFVARVIFFGADKGGRYNPPQSGFHPQIDVGDGIYTSCIVESIGDDHIFSFDKEFEVLLKLIFPEQYEKNLSEGSEVRLYEGSKLIGQGKIINQRVG